MAWPRASWRWRVLAAAKAHGRQLRLERVQAGHPHADFRGGNHPWVEALWRRDRVRFWTLFAVLAPLLVAVATLARPLSPATVGAAALAMAWALAACFCATGLASLARQRARAGDLAASLAWWLAVAALFAASAWLA